MASQGAFQQSVPGTPSQVTRLARAALLVVAFAFAFFVLQRLTFLLRFPPYERTTLWVPGALTFSALILTPPRQWWIYYLGLCIGAVAAYYGDLQIPGHIAFLSAQFHFATVALGAWAIRRFTQDLVFSTVRSIIFFLIVAGLVVPLATTIPVDVARWFSNQSDLGPVALRSFLCVSLGMLIATPAFTMAIKVGGRWFRSCTRNEWIEAILLTCCHMVVGFWVFTSSQDSHATPALVYAPIPFLIWAALRFEVAGASWALLALAYLSTWNAINDRGPFVGGTTDDHVLQLQLFLLAVSLPLLLMAASVHERRSAFARMAHEIDERRKMEDQFRLVVESTPNAMLMVDQDGRMILVNQRAEQLFGHRREKLLTQPIEFLVPERLRSQLSEYLRPFCESPSLGPPGLSTELFGLRKDGTEFPIEIGLTQIETAQGVHVLAAIVDMTERRRAEETQRELVHASRLAMLSEFTASIAHEINQPLGAILSNADAAEMLLDSSNPPLDEVRSILIDIRNDDLRASEVIRKMRNLLRRGELERQPIDLNHVITDVLALLRVEIQRRGITICTDLESNLSIIHGDRIHMQQVLLNLLLNGMEAMSKISRIKTLTIRTVQENEELQLSVTDVGPGIPEDRIPKLFDRFFSTKEEGMGMGLAISRSIVERHGGRIGVESVIGAGTTFRVYLPTEPGIRSHAIPLEQSEVGSS
ncbi:MAG: PAS domain S-box protein [Planctomycetes bacterium]|nr:PAS domain S-box protein [Planctomycetota bacterium]